jgi:outer membrane protein
MNLMKQFSTYLNIILAVAVAVLFYLHFKERNNNKANNNQGEAKSVKVAYFELDSIQNNYGFFKDVVEDINQKEKKVKEEIAKKKNEFQNLYLSYSQQAKSMTPEQYASAQKQLENMQREIQIEEQNKGGAFSEETRNSLIKVKKAIEEYVKVYNANKHYTIILSNSSNAEFMYYKDSTIDITKDLIKGLNEEYKKNKKSPK